MVGNTKSNNFPITAVSPPFGGGTWGDAFLTKLDLNTPRLVYSRYVGGSGDDDIREVVVDAAGDAYVAGATDSVDFPTVDPIQDTFKGGVAPDGYTYLGPGDGLIVRFDAAGMMTFGSYLDGTGAEAVPGIALGPDGNVYMAGGTSSTDFPLANAFQGTNGEVFDSFVGVISFGPPGTPTETRTRTPTIGTPTLSPTVTDPPTVTNTPTPTSSPLSYEQRGNAGGSAYTDTQGKTWGGRPGFHCRRLGLRGVYLS